MPEPFLLVYFSVKYPVLCGGRCFFLSGFPADLPAWGFLVLYLMIFTENIYVIFLYHCGSLYADPCRILFGIVADDLDPAV